ncbi:UvrD-helicase domain-containing protein [Pectobacterium parvum]|uniref:UvrD-helicase domain-containing protein n=1 Tax=Pectobacterium parvum TaxID=2778550 RepID=UPI000DC64618|nr:ATP-dependent helicase [Pectobacterium parvum]
MIINFTDEQKEAIAYPSSMVLTACPGSGKTAVIVAKIIQDLENCRDYQGVIAISYTNKASDELKKRCLKSAPDTKLSFFGTMDKFYLTEIIYQYVNHLWGYVDKLSVIKFSDLESEYKTKLSDYTNSEYICGKIDECNFTAIHELYLKGVIVLEFIPLLAYYILTRSSSCRRYLSIRFKSIYIDEYQDAGYIQHLIFIGLFNIGIKATAVGDKDQSIYSYAGKSSKYLVSLLEKGSGFESFEITINHRSHPSIVNYASRLMNENSVLLASDVVHVYRTTINGTQKNIAEWIDANISNVKDTFGVRKECDIAILTATNSSVSLVSDLIKTHSRAYLDDDLSSLGGEVSLLVKDLLNFRYNRLTTAQSIIDNLHNKILDVNLIRKMRGVIKKVRETNYEGLIPALRQAISLLTASELTHQHIDAINSIMNNKMMLNNYLPVSDNELQIMTLHKAKGLEFDFVFHLDLYDWILPRREYIKGCFDVVFSQYEQCLNLHYVGITRAKKAVVLLNSTERFNFQHELKKAKPSQFLSLNGLDGLYKNI